jgi:peptide/nickel transport system ATP-binding protein/oligopeptide transport system ATP-binding protein
LTESDLLIVEGLRKFFPLGGAFLKRPTAYVRAVDRVSLRVLRGETFAVVGESGCGKTTLGRCILQLETPTEGRVVFEGRDITTCARHEAQRLKRHMQIIFQDPYSSLNRRMTVGRIIGEGLAIHERLAARERQERVLEMMRVVGLRKEYINRYPHEFSGGQRQRIGIARALVLQPKLIVADEPVSALDVSIQAQILNLMIKLQHRFALTYIFISHDLSVVRHISDRLAVMYLGRIVETAPSSSIYEHPLHPYSEALISAAPIANPAVRKKTPILSGDVPSPIDIPPGCSFHPRCIHTQDICREVRPELQELEPNHSVACHFPLNPTRAHRSP